MKILTSLLLVLACLLLPAAASAQGAFPPPPGMQPPQASGPAYGSSEEDHTGFFFRGTIGLGYGSASISDSAGTDLIVSGTGVAFRLGIGGSVAPNLAIYADLGGVGVPGPDVEYGGLSGSASSDTTMVLAGVGVGLSYYLMPANLYVGGALRAMQLSSDDGRGGTSESDLGFGIAFVFGKEFWVGGGWGLGPALEIELGSVPDGAIDQSWTLFSAALTLSITYN
ncbi:MAG: hypothetical protein OEY14_16715 [Myxococcales bacterium]|nr:hypothetical protein [Myxococcales bacterium]